MLCANATRACLRGPEVRGDIRKDDVAFSMTAGDVTLRSGERGEACAMR